MTGSFSTLHNPILYLINYYQEKKQEKRQTNIKLNQLQNNYSIQLSIYIASYFYITEQDFELNIPLFYDKFEHLYIRIRIS